MTQVTIGRIWAKLVFASLLCFSLNAYAAFETTITINKGDIQTGFILKKLPLKHYAKPQLIFKNIVYTAAGDLPEDVYPTDIQNFEVLLGMDRKVPFAVARIPAYSLAENGKDVRQIKELTIEVVEESSSINKERSRSAAKTTASNSPLASGNWYKLSVKETGLYKVEHSFLSNNLGVNSVPSNQVRLFGYGGNMLPEKNLPGDIKGLTQTEIWMNDGGDGSFDPGDYFVFYGQGVRNWNPTDDNSALVQEINLFEDKGYYFISLDEGGGKRIEDQANVPTGTVTVNSFTGTALHEMENVNPQEFGKGWWGEEFSSAPGKQTTQSFTLNLGDGVIGDATFKVNVINTAQTSATFNVTMNGQQFGSASINPTNYDEYAPRALGNLMEQTMPYSSSTATFQVTYNTGSDGSGYLDFISANTRRRLNMYGNTLVFSDLQGVGAGNVATYNLSNANNSTQVWDVTNPQSPVRMKGSLQGNTYVFTQSAEELHTFIAFNDVNSALTPDFEGPIMNQNLFGHDQVDYVIVTYPGFLDAAERLADFHRNRSDMRVVVATTTQVYNEFSSGGQDISAIRDYVRMFYQRAGTNDNEMPKYLLLMGDASYDYKDRIGNNTNFVPIYESDESYQFLGTFSNDDYFGFLDEGEEIRRYDIVNALDIGVGRIPAKTLQEADDVVNKVMHYKSPATLGKWRLSTMFVADDEDNAGPHMSDAENMHKTVDRNSNIHNSTKVYQNAIPMISTPSGHRAPQANKAINDGIFRGTFFINYSGHGNIKVLSHERILTKDDYNKWRNMDQMPFMVTATCDFGQFDQPSFVSAGEELLLKNNGGVIATLTTTHLVYAYANEILNRGYLDAQFKHVNGKWNTFGDAIRIGKNVAYSDGSSTSDLLQNFRKFALLGDPALEPNFPEYFIETESILDGATGQATNKIGALGEYIVNGKVTDVNKNVLSDFNGELSVTIFDKARTVKVTTYDGQNKSFQQRTNTIYKGKATVTDGKFTFTFIAPKDINYELGKGRFSYYAHNGKTDAAGRDTNFNIGGFSDNPRIEDNPPLVRPFIKDSLFRSGGLTGSNTALFVILEDETGINVSGNSVGHDLIAILDGDVSQPYIMNDYYETESNTFKRGYVYFPIEGIPEGRHRITVKAWDVNNNSGTGFIDFEVADGRVVKVQQLGNYPNPFRDKTHFVFEHNRPDEDLKAEINIYNTSGVFVRKLTQDFISTGSKSNEITWDGTDNSGAKLPSGMYIYRMMISTPAGIETTAYQKLVLVR